MISMKNILSGVFAVVFSAVSVHGQGVVKWENAGAGLDFGKGNGIASLSAGGKSTTVYAAVDGAGIFKSTDQGKSWTQLKGDAACLSDPCWVTTTPQDDNIVFAAVKAANGGLFRSEDGGKTWTKCAGLANDNVESVTVSTNDQNLVLVGHKSGKEISLSVDAGKTWSKKDIGADIKGQVIFMVSDTRWVITGREQGDVVRFTENGGSTWESGKGDTAHHTGAIVMVQTGEYLFSTKHHGHNKSTDGGKTWAYTMENHNRMVGTLGSTVFRETVKGHRDGYWMWLMESSADYGGHWSEATYSLIDVVTAANGSLPANFTNMNPFVENRIATAWAAAPDAKMAFLGLGRYGVYACRVVGTGGGGAPIIAEAKIAPTAIIEGDTKTTIKAQAIVTSRKGKITKVFADLSALGQTTQLELFDDGKHDDGAAEDKTYANSMTPPKGLQPGEKQISIIAEDDKGMSSSANAKLSVSAMANKLIVWNGDKYARGLGWVGPQIPLNFFKTQTEEAHEGKVALELRGEGSGWIGGGWNWHGWYPEGSGDDISGYANLSFWVKVEGDNPGGLSVTINCSSTKKATKSGGVQEYIGDEDLVDGKWHEVVIPLKDIMTDDFDKRKAWEMDINTWAPQKRAFSVYIDEIGFDNRPIRSHADIVIFPIEREGKPVKDAAAVSADIDNNAQGTPISPWIYGASMGDRKVGLEAGVTMMRAGGNPLTPMNWKHGYSGAGGDWYYVNTGKETPPEQNWIVTFHDQNKKAGIETYLSLPTMGRVAKDGTSVAFDINKYPDQESWAGKVQPTDPHPNAGNGRQYVRDEKGEFKTDAKGNKILRDIEPDPDDTSVEMSYEEQCEVFKFALEKMGYGTAEKGGIKALALDNEPCLWASTHRGMHPKGCSYEELWNMTEKCASYLKKVDPSVKIAGPTFWGWTAYFLSGLDAQMVGRGKGTWDAPPDFTANGSVPITKWWLKKLAAYEKEKGVRLVDILDFHFYPQTGIYMSGTPNDPKTMEGRVQETRVMWDPDYVDPSWIAGDINGRKMGGKIKLIRMMKEWIAECNPGMEISLGEYNFGGDKDVSGCVAQSELLGVFAREQVGYAFIWLFPYQNSPSYFAWKMFRNPDGKKTAFGDRYLPATVSEPTDISVHSAKDTKTGNLTFVIVNKRAAKDAKLTLKFKKSVPAQDMVVYEYSSVDRFSIAQLPARQIKGDKIELDVPSMTVLRFDLKP